MGSIGKARKTFLKPIDIVGEWKYNLLCTKFFAESDPIPYGGDNYDESISF
jgi:hypothetical protein